MKVFAYNPSYSEEFDPYFVTAETAEEARKKIRECLPNKILSEYELKPLEHPGVVGLYKKIDGVSVLQPTGEWLR